MNPTSAHRLSRIIPKRNDIIKNHVKQWILCPKGELTWDFSRTPRYWRNCIRSCESCRTVFDVATIAERIAILEERTVTPNFWTGPDVETVSRELSHLQELQTAWSTLEKEYDELSFLEAMLRETDDPGFQREFESRTAALKETIEQRKLLLLLDGEYDAANAIVSVHAGSGGLDSQDWAEMLYRMYSRWAERNGFSLKIYDLQQDEEAGIKNATFLVEGTYAYGYLKAEKGVHRLVRISPFDAAKRRHTSFASVQAAPELPDSVEIEIRPEDLKVDTFRSSGAGGQYVNRTDSAVRITHLPTGIVVGCQNERSQHMNRQVAMNVLRARLFEKVLQERQSQLDQLQGEKKESSWGNQIRSYVLHPYTLVKDHRTSFETGNIQAVLDGDIGGFISAYLKWSKRNAGK